MPCLVEGQNALLLLGDDAPLLEPRDDPVHRRVEVVLADVLRARAAGENRSLVAEVREIGSGEPGCLPRDDAEVDVRRERLVARVHLQDRLATGDVRCGNQHLAVEAARSQQRRVEVLQSIGSSHDDDLVTRVEAVELDEELVQRLGRAHDGTRLRSGRCRPRRARR